MTSGSAVNAMSLSAVVAKSYVSRQARALNHTHFIVGRNSCRPVPDRGDNDTAVFAAASSPSYSLLATSHDGRIVYSGTGVGFGRGIFKSEDFGWSWRRVYLAPGDSSYGYSCNLVWCSENGQYVVACENEGYQGHFQAVWSDDGGNTWHNVSSWSWVNVWEYSAWGSADAQHIRYMQNGLFQASDDGGKTWYEPVRPRGTIDFMEGSADGSVIFAGYVGYSTCEWFRSRDLGLTWDLPINSGFEMAFVRACSRGGDVIYGESSAEGYWISLDQCSSLHKLSNFPAGINSSTIGTKGDGHRVWGVNAAAKRFYWSDDYGETWAWVSIAHGVYTETAAFRFQSPEGSDWFFTGGGNFVDPLIRLFVPEFSAAVRNFTHAKAKNAMEWMHGRGHGQNLIVDPQLDDTYSGSGLTLLRSWYNKGYIGKGHAHLALAPTSLPPKHDSALEWVSSYSDFDAGSQYVTQTLPFIIPPELRGKQVTGYIWTYPISGMSGQWAWTQVQWVRVSQYRGFEDAEYSAHAIERTSYIGTAQGAAQSIVDRGSPLRDGDAPFDAWTRHAGFWPTTTANVKGPMQLDPNATHLVFEVYSPALSAQMWYTGFGITRYYSDLDPGYRDGDSSGWQWSGVPDKSYSSGEYPIAATKVMGARTRNEMEYLVQTSPTHTVPPRRVTPKKGMLHVAPEIQRTKGAGVLHIAPEVRRK